MKRVALAVLLLAVVGVAACGDEKPAQPAVQVPNWAKVAPEQIAEAKKYGVPVAVENDLGMRFVLIPAGTFLMGSPEDEEGRDNDETQHEVTITKPFYMQITEVTMRDYHEAAPGSQDAPPQDRIPPERADWPVVAFYAGAVHFAGLLSQHDALRTYRLPTEAEWERACRAGTTTAYSTGRNIPRTSANYGSAIQSARGVARPTPVASYPPNGWGLYDMHGNVREWCLDQYAAYATEPISDPLVTDPPRGMGAVRVRRGGCFRDDATELRSARRTRLTGKIFSAPMPRETGFRLVSPLPEPEGGK